MSYSWREARQAPQSDSSVKLEPLSAVCCACLGDSALRHMFDADYIDGKLEVYPKMMLTCFNIQIIPEQNNMNDNLMICEACILRLRDAYTFKLQIENSQKLFQKQLELLLVKNGENVQVCDELNFLVKTELSNDGSFLNNSDDDFADSKSNVPNLVQVEIRYKRAEAKIKSGNLKVKHDERNAGEMSSKSELQRYQMNKDDLMCGICKESFPLHRTLLRHLNTHFPNYICDVCGQFFAEKRKLTSHVVRHGNVEQRCPICNKTYKCPDNFKKHMKQHKDPNPVYKCPKCPERFTGYYGRMKHLVEAHNEEPARYKCKQCPKRFLVAGALSRHVRKDHLQERNRICPECGSAFFTKHALNQHMVKHTGIKNFQCNVCQKSFGKKYTLTEHMRIHTNDKRFECSVCTRRFTQKCTLKGHMKTHKEILALTETDQ